MKLLRLPLLAKEEVFSHLTINQLFILSLCSKTTKNYIIQTNHSKKVERINYVIHGETIVIDSIVTKNSHIIRDVLMFASNTPAGFHLSGPSVEKLRVMRAAIDCLSSNGYKHDLEAMFNSDVDSILEAIHNHLYDLFGDHTKFWLESSSREFKWFPILRNIQKMEIDGDGFESTEVDEFLTGSTCLEYFSWTALYERENRLRENSKIYELDTVQLSMECPLVTDVMRHFNGRHAFLKGYTIATTDVIEFLNSWISGEKFRNLEVASLEGHFNVSMIRDSIEFKELKTKVKCSFFRKFCEPCEFESNLYMIRKSDGHVASVQTTPKIFVGVWKMTEKQFLEEFQ